MTQFTIAVKQFHTKRNQLIEPLVDLNVIIDQSKTQITFVASTVALIKTNP